jgi:hypothetical protein
MVRLDRLVAPLMLVEARVLREQEQDQALQRLAGYWVEAAEREGVAGLVVWGLALLVLVALWDSGLQVLLFLSLLLPSEHPASRMT